METTDQSDDKPLAFFSADTGCTVHEIATTFQNQSDESRETLWEKLSKSKSELTTFVDIYTITMGLIAMTLKAKEDTSRPPQNAIKSLTQQIILKLPKNSNDDPILSKDEFLQNIYNILSDIHFNQTDDKPRNEPETHDDYTTLNIEDDTQQTLMEKTEPTDDEAGYAPVELVPMDEIETDTQTQQTYPSAPQSSSIAQDITEKWNAFGDCIDSGKDSFCDNCICEFIANHALTLACLLFIGAIVACVFGSIRLQDAEKFKHATEAQCTYVATIKQTCKFWPDSDDTATTFNPFEKSDGIIKTYIYNSSLCPVGQALIDTLEPTSGNNYDKTLRENKVLFEKSIDECDEEQDGKNAHTTKSDECHINSCGGDNFTWSSAEEHYNLGVALMIIFAVAMICCCALCFYYGKDNM